MEKLPINQKKIDELVRQCKHLNIFPIYLPRYYPKIKLNPISILLSELVSESRDYLSIMNESEIEVLINRIPPGLKFLLEGSERTLNGYDLERIALYYVMYLVQAKYFSIKKVLSSDKNKEIVLSTYPELRERLDKDDLLMIDNKFELLDGGISYKNHILHYHQFLRRGYSSNPNFSFLTRFIRYCCKTKNINQFRIAIDHHRLMPKEFYQRLSELDEWFGPRFDKSKLDDINAVGLTIIKRQKPSIFDLDYKLDRTEFYWSYRDGIKEFEVEEISSAGNTFESYYLNRYVHSERDVKRKVLNHFDGAVRVYLKNDYKRRISTNFPNEFKCFKKIKLFRIDGDICLDEWIELIGYFYKSNEMIIEYFNREQFINLFGEQIEKYKKFKEGKT